MSTLTLKSLLRDIADEAPCEPDVQVLLTAALPHVPSTEAARIVDRIVDWGGEFAPDVATALRAHPDVAVRRKAWHRSFKTVSAAEWNARAAVETDLDVRENMLLATPAHPGPALSALMDVSTLEDGPDDAASRLLTLLPREHGWAVSNALKAFPRVPAQQSLPPAITRLVEFHDVEPVLDDENIPALYRLLLAAGAFTPPGHVPAAIAAVREEATNGFFSLGGATVSPVVELALNAMADVPVGRSDDRRALLEFGRSGALAPHSPWASLGDEIAADFEARERVSVTGLAEYAGTELQHTLPGPVQSTALWHRVPASDRTDSWCEFQLTHGVTLLIPRVLEHLGDRARSVMTNAIADPERPRAARWLMFVAPEVWIAEARELDAASLGRQVYRTAPGQSLTAREVAEQNRQASEAARLLRADLLVNPHCWSTHEGAELARELELTEEEYTHLPVRLVRAAGWDKSHTTARTALMNAFLKAAAPDAALDGAPDAVAVVSAAGPELTRAVRIAALDAMLSSGDGEMLLGDLQMVHII